MLSPSKLPHLLPENDNAQLAQTARSEAYLRWHRVKLTPHYVAICYFDDETVYEFRKD